MSNSWLKVKKHSSASFLGKKNEIDIETIERKIARIDSEKDKRNIEFLLDEISNDSNMITKHLETLQKRLDALILMMKTYERNRDTTGAAPVKKEIDEMENTRGKLQQTNTKIDNLMRRFFKKKVEVLYDYDATDENQLSVRAGQIAIVLSDQDESWILGRVGTLSGFFPKNYCRPIDHLPMAQADKKQTSFQPSLSSIPIPGVTSTLSSMGRVLYDYQAQSPAELTISFGDVLKILSMQGNDWWEGDLNGKIGYFPKDYVQLIDSSAENSSEKSIKTTPPQATTNDSSLISPATSNRSVISTGRRKVKALFDYVPIGNTELALKAGDVIDLLLTEDDQWWEGELNGKIGYFPKNYVNLLEEGNNITTATDSNQVIQTHLRSPGIEQEREEKTRKEKEERDRQEKEKKEREEKTRKEKEERDRQEKEKKQGKIRVEDVLMQLKEKGLEEPSKKEPLVAKQHVASSKVFKSVSSAGHSPLQAPLCNQGSSISSPFQELQSFPKTTGTSSVKQTTHRIGRTEKDHMQSSLLQRIENSVASSHPVSVENEIGNLQSLLQTDVRMVFEKVQTQLKNYILSFPLLFSTETEQSPLILESYEQLQKEIKQLRLNLNELQVNTASLIVQRDIAERQTARYEAEARVLKHKYKQMQIEIKTEKLRELNSSITNLESDYRILQMYFSNEKTLLNANREHLVRGSYYLQKLKTKATNRLQKLKESLQEESLRNQSNTVEQRLQQISKLVDVLHVSILSKFGEIDSALYDRRALWKTFNR